MFFHTIVHDSFFAPAAGRLEPYDVSVARDRDLRAYANLHFLNGITIDTPARAEVVFNNPEGFLFARKFESGRSAAALAVLDDLMDAV
jgi:hypothetical protein